MQIENNTHANKKLYEQIGVVAVNAMLPYIDRIFSTVDCKTDKIATFDSPDSELQIKFTAIKNVDGVFDLKLVVAMTLSNLGAKVIPLYERVLNMETSVIPAFDFKILQKVYQAANQFGGSENFRTYHDIDRMVDKSFDEQMKIIFDAYNDHFVRAVEVYRKTIASLVEKNDTDILTALPDVNDLFIF